MRETWSSCEWSPGKKVYGRNPAEIQQRVAAAKAGRAITGPQPPWLTPTPAASGGNGHALRGTAAAAPTHQTTTTPTRAEGPHRGTSGRNRRHNF